MNVIDNAINAVFVENSVEIGVQLLLETPHIMNASLKLKNNKCNRNEQFMDLDLFAEFMVPKRLGPEIQEMYSDVSFYAVKGKDSKLMKNKISYCCYGNHFFSVSENENGEYEAISLLKEHEKYVKPLTNAFLRAAESGREVYAYKLIAGNYLYVHSDDGPGTGLDLRLQS